MKKSLKITIRIICFVLLCGLVFSVIYKVLSWKDTMGETGSSVNQLRHEKKDTMDVVFVGSSHVYSGISPAELWSEYGIAAFDMAISAMDRDSAYYNLKYLLRTQSPKVVFVDVLPLTYERHMVRGNEYRNMLSLPYSIESYELVKAYVLSEEQQDFLTKFPIIHTRYQELAAEDFYDSGFAVYGRGEKLCYDRGGNADFTTAMTCDTVGELTEKDLEWLEKLRKLAEKEDFKLVLFVTPYTSDEEAQSKFNAVSLYASENGIPFLDLTKKAGEIGLDGNEDFYDAGHMNDSGAVKTSRWLGTYLAENYDLTDRRGDPDYTHWDQDVAYGVQKRMLYTLESVKNSGRILEAIQYLTCIPGIQYVVSLDGTWEESMLPVYDYLEALSIPVEEIGSGGIWVGSMGQNIHIMSNEATESVYYSFDRYTAAKFSKTLGEELGNIKIGNENCQLAYNGLTIVFYDESDHTVNKFYGLY